MSSSAKKSRKKKRWPDYLGTLFDTHPLCKAANVAAGRGN
jgi:hypothetical protein